MWTTVLRTFSLLAVVLAVGLGTAEAQTHSAARTWNEQNLAAIRINVPNPPAHARNLFHNAAAMYDAWAAYDSTAVGYIYNEKVSPLPPDVEAARAEAISYASYRVLYSRYSVGTGAATSVQNFRDQMTALGYSYTTAEGAITTLTTPAELGKRIGQAILTYGASDGFSKTAFPQAYTTVVNPNMDPNLSLPVMGNNGEFPTRLNMQLGVGIPLGTNPNFWQPLALSTAVSQNGIPSPGGIQSYVGVQMLAANSFSLTRSDSTLPWIDPFGGPSKLGTASDAAYKSNFMDVLIKSSQLNDPTVVDISPGVIGNNPIGTDNGTGYTENPITHTPYDPNPVKRSDFVRVLAEFWADGPNSETPPGHWHVLANEVADDPALVKRIGGTGPIVNDLEWDVKTYFALAGGTHDAACAAWSLKRYYSGTRPITAIRYMASKGQSSDPQAANYNVEGLPLQAGVVELVTNDTAASGGKHEFIWNMYTNSYDNGVNHLNEVVVYSWPGEDYQNLPAPSIATHQATVRWMLAKDWVPFQRKSFNTPAFPGYVSGHSTFSRASAEVLTNITGSASFPGGFHNRTVTANSLQIDQGPSASVDLQWNTYYDAADQAGISRRWGGIHPYEDDFHGRVIGSQAGNSAFTLAQKFWTGTIQTQTIQPVVTIQSNGNAVVTWPSKVGKYYKLQSSTNLITWSDVTVKIFTPSTTGSYTVAAPPVGTFYQVIESSPGVARTWNEHNLAAIRINVPNPPAHARNLFHVATAMYNAWAAYDPTAVGYIYNEKISPLPGDVEAARNEAISYAAYRVLYARYSVGQGAATSVANFRSQMTAFGYSYTVAEGTLTSLTTPAELGKRIGDAILTYGASDGFSNTTFPQAYTTAVNPNMDPNLSLPVLGNNGEFPTRLNMQLGVGVPVGTNPNFWQPLALSTSVTQNGIPTAGGIQTYVGVQMLATKAFSLTRTDNTRPWIDPFGGPSKLGTASDAAYKDNFMDVVLKTSQINDAAIVDISPGAVGNNPLGADSGTGHAINPVTGLPYAANPVKRSDFVRVLAEFWADGPNSETPPGHWHVLANEVADDPDLVKRIGGAGPVVDDLEWDIKTYFSLAGGVHDAACAAWSLKRYYSGVRPITAIRYMGSKGQSSDPNGPSYHVEGLPLMTDVVEVITNTTSAPGGKHEFIWDMYTNSYQNGVFHVGEVAVYSWPGEDPSNLPAPSIATHQSTVRWMLAKDWVPFQRKTFNTPAFPGYVSGHSTFSRSAAEVLTNLTGSANFPGGFHHRTIAANSMQIDQGPSTDVDLQWTTYYDAADQAGTSRRWGGIHPYEDDFHGRTIGAQAGQSAYTLAQKFWSGSIQTQNIQPVVTIQSNGNVVVTWPSKVGKYYKLQSSTNLTTWSDVTVKIFTPSTTGSYTVAAPPAGTFYQVIESSPGVARAWNEQNLAAIRINVPNPPAHARNLFHVATAMYDAWAAYDATAVGYIYNEKVSPLPVDIESARNEAISYAAYRVLSSRYSSGAGAATTMANLDAQLSALGYSPIIAQGALSNGLTPAEVGKRVGQAILTYGASDGFSNTTFPQAYDTSVNPNMASAKSLSVLGNNGEFPSRSNMPLGVGVPVGTNPNFWQPLALSTVVTQNGIPTPGGIQSYVGVQMLATNSFSLSRSDNTKPWIDPFGGPSKLGTASDAAYKSNFMDVLMKSAQLNDLTPVDISPGAVGNNPLGSDSGTGHATNPVTGQPYAANQVKRSDFVRVLAEFWADGPNSETPPGHWHVLANEVADDPALVKRIGGTGPVVNDLEWDVKTYFSLAGGVHDAACAAWSLKRYYSGTRPITAIRYMGSKGQSSDPNGPSYNVEGLPLMTDVVEVITNTSSAPGGKHEYIWDMYTNSYQNGVYHLGEVAVYSWPGEDPSNLPAPSIATHQSTVRWMLAKDWVPFQRKTFNTPAFPGYVSGHSTFSRSAAEVLTNITGSANFPGGFHHRTIAANSLQIDQGPSTDVDLQWTTYYDAADQAGTSRRWGGIHPYEDDFHGRTIGAQAGQSAYTLAQKFWSGSIQTQSLQPIVTLQANGDAVVTWPAIVGKYFKVQSSTNLTSWTDVSGNIYAYTTSGSFTVKNPTPGTQFRVIQSDPSIARTWNEQIIAAIRIDKPNPPVHARNLFHLSTVMYDCWAAYDTKAVGYIHHERDTAADVAAARRESISYAAYRLLKSRYATSANAATTMAALDAQMATLGYDINVVGTVGTTPAAVGNRIAATIMAWGLNDNSNQAGGYTDPTYSNPQPPMVVLQGGVPRGFGVPEGTDPNRWQPLAMDASIAQNGIVLPSGVQSYVGVTWLKTLPFAHTRSDPAAPWIDPGPPSRWGDTSDAEYKAGALYVLEASALLNSNTVIDMSPGAMGNNPLGTEDGTGHTVNPYTGQPYAPNPVKYGDYSRVMAEFWADGPKSETPPGHWHVLANQVADNPLTVKKIGGVGPVVDDLEWDIKTYFSLAGATHDAACAAWGLKRYYEGVRPITAIRYMGALGQSSDPGQLSYNPGGLLLEPGVCEVITPQTAGSGGRHEGVGAVGEIAVYSWPGEPNDPATQDSPVRWMRAVDWQPYQRKTFNTPAFPGYISGHSTFSRAAAEIMTSITGNAFFPGGIGTFTADANAYLVFERGPTQTTTLQWATYYDAADLAGQSRRWGGIHVREDDYKGRIVGSQSGKQVWKLAQKYWDGSIMTEDVTPTLGFQPGGGVVIKAPCRRGLYYHLEACPDLQNWHTVGSEVLATDSVIKFTDPAGGTTPTFYRVVFLAKTP